MELTGSYRHEWKYAIGEGEYQLLSRRLRPVLRQDSHAGAEGCYLVRSVYFDNYRNKALREKLDGVPQREKFRVRWYNDDLTYIVLEKKSKYNDLCRKTSASLTAEEANRLLTSPGTWMLSHPAELVRELYCKMQTQQLRPRVQVSYRREPYVFPAGNVRVTLDSHIRSSLFRSDLTLRPLPDISAVDTAGTRILEVKYDDFLPELVADLLQTGTLRRQSFSKYGACRRFG